jgi:hypothetical protein
MQGTGRTVQECWETLPCLLTFSLGSTGDKSGWSQRRTGEWAGLFELRRCMLVVAASCGRRFVTVSHHARCCWCHTEVLVIISENGLLAGKSKLDHLLMLIF